MRVSFAEGTKIEEAAERAIKIQEALDLAFFLGFNEESILVDRPDTKWSIMHKYYKRKEEQKSPH